MEKGNYGVRLAFYAVVAFLMVFFGGYTTLFLLAGVTIFIEKNEWASRQVIQAFCLATVPSLIAVVFQVLGFFDWMSWASNDVVYAIYRGWNRFESIVNYAVNIVVYIFALIGLLNVAKGKEAGIPLADKFASWAYGKMKVVLQQPVYSAPTQQAAPADVCANCGASLNGGAFCPKCGTPVAK